MKKRTDKFERDLKEIINVVDMLNQEGKSYAECRYRVIMATRLLLVEDSLRFIRTLLAIIIGLLVGNLLKF